MKLLGVTFTGVDVTFDVTIILIILFGMLIRFCLEWYKTAKDKSVPYDINWPQQIASSLIAVLAYAVIVLMAAHKFTAGEAFLFGLAPQSIINELNNLREASGSKPILMPPVQPPKDE